MIWNPFPNSTKSIMDICTIFSKLLYNLHLITNLSLSVLKAKIVLEIIDEKIMATSWNDNKGLLNLERQVFKIYNRFKALLDFEINIPSPLYKIDSELVEPKYSTITPLIGAPLLLLEPDRIIHLAYGITNGYCVAKWADSFGEYESSTILKIEPNCSVVETLYNQTVKRFGTDGFHVRLTVCQCPHWTESDIHGKRGI